MKTLEAWGISLRDMFGMTETGGIGAQVGKWPAPEFAIKPMAACQVRLSADGELCLRSPGNVTGYWNDEAASKALLDPEGYVHSGDIATVFEEGAFRIVDRKKDILITSGGKNIAPATVENALRCSPYISEVIVFGDQRRYCLPLIEIDFENVAQWARQHQIPYTGYMSLSQNEKIVQLIAQGSRPTQSAAGARRAGQEIQDPAERAGSGGWRYDADAQGETRRMPISCSATSSKPCMSRTTSKRPPDLIQAIHHSGRQIMTRNRKVAAISAALGARARARGGRPGEGPQGRLYRRPVGPDAGQLWSHR